MLCVRCRSELKCDEWIDKMPMFDGKCRQNKTKLITLHSSYSSADSLSAARQNGKEMRLIGTKLN